MNTDLFVAEFVNQLGKSFHKQIEHFAQDIKTKYLGEKKVQFPIYKNGQDLSSLGKIIGISSNTPQLLIGFHTEFGGVYLRNTELQRYRHLRIIEELGIMQEIK